MWMTVDDARPSICLSLCRVDDVFEVYSCDDVTRLSTVTNIGEIARCLLQTGAPAETQLVIRHCRSDRIWIKTTVGAASAKRRFEGDNVHELKRGNVNG
jgi:hypothetical protein